MLTAVEYFAGIGLVRMGLEPYGWRVVFANDICRKKFELYKAFFPDAEACYTVGNIFDIKPEKVPPATLATCSFPCTDLSLAGNRQGMGKSGPRSSGAFRGFAGILKNQGGAAPPLVLVENVPGWLYSNKGMDFRSTVRTLNELGYACDVFALDARHFTPQSRLRIFLVGAKTSVGGRHAAASVLTRSRYLLPPQLARNITDNGDLRWFCLAIPEPPPLRSGGLSTIVEVLDEADSRWWPGEQVERHLAMMNEMHRRRVETSVDSSGFTYRAFSRRIRHGQQRVEVRNDDLSGCLRTARGGSGRQFLVRAGRGAIRMRAMTPREYARLQGVPDTYPIPVNGGQALTGFGDAVCVPAISWIAQQVLKPLIGEDVG